MTTTREGLRRRMEARAGVEKEYTIAEVRKHNKCLDNWIILGGKAYDVSGFDSHPGGYSILEQCAGTDSTDAFSVNHDPEQVLPLLQKYYLGEVKDAKEPSAVIKDFHDLDSHFEAEGLYRTDVMYYAKLMVWFSALFAVVLLPFTMWEQTYFTMTISGVALGLFWQQWAFVGHDAGHNAVFHDRKGLDYYASLIVIAAFGVSGQWWKRNHNCHHIVTNSINGDPDIQYLPVFMVDSKMMQSVYSFYHKTRFVYDKVGQKIVSYQHITYLPIMALARHNLYLQSWLFVLSGKEVRNRWVEASVLLCYAWWVAELVMRIDDSGMAWYWWFLSHGVCGVLHLQITLSHFSMEAFLSKEGTIHRSEDDDFVRHQLATSLDVDCYPWMDWFHGGLQFQVVHHLWPRLPRHNTRHIRDKYLIPLCEKHGLTYHRLSFYDSIVKTLSHMKEQANVAANSPPGSSMIMQSMNLEG
eukprot:TRINITY_DN4604_c0_g1_i1.p1 TRINITY_DN4604_c0_g1~~TRINITY_DN4604_c0_g1_i1.p1  ORF type:complete len:468 (+),score=147.95 TRINITY_DN4604_c0_g1_i1:40-1443(+)